MCISIRSYGQYARAKYANNRNLCVVQTISSENNRLDASSGTSNNEQRMSLLKITEKNNTIGDMQLELMTEMNQFEYWIKWMTDEMRDREEEKDREMVKMSGKKETAKRIL